MHLTHHTKNKMGAALSIFGKINEESPHFSLLKKTAEYEIRRYAQSIAVETSYEAVRCFLYISFERERERILELEMFYRN